MQKLLGDMVEKRKKVKKKKEDVSLTALIP
jgi:hypothetical protein